MPTTLMEPRQILETDLDTHLDWNRPLPSPGHMGVDFEKRVDFRRLHRYRLARARQALAASRCGALLLFDTNNIRYVTGTKIGEWGARQAVSVRPSARQRGAGPVGLRLGRGPPPDVLRLAGAGELPGRHARDARDRCRPRPGS